MCRPCLPVLDRTNLLRALSQHLFTTMIHLKRFPRGAPWCLGRLKGMMKWRRCTSHILRMNVGFRSALYVEELGIKVFNLKGHLALDMRLFNLFIYILHKS